MAESDLANLRNECIKSLYMCTDNICKYLDSEKDEEFQKLRKYVEDYCKQEAEEEVAIEALEKAKNEIDASNINTLESKFREHLKTMAKKKVNKTSTDKHPFMVEFNKKIKEGLEKPNKPVVTDEDVYITESCEQYIDPILKKPIEDPVRNTVCDHIYEKTSIMALLHKNHKLKCPVIGCLHGGYIRSEHLISDDNLKRRVEQVNSQHALSASLGSPISLSI